VLRGRSGAIGREAVDVLLECLDALAAAVDAIAADGTDALDPAALVARLDGLVAADGAPVAAEAAVPATPPAVDGRVLHVRAELAADVLMPSVRAYMVLAAAGDHGEVSSSTPAEDALDGFTGHAVEAWVVTDHEAEQLQAAVAAVPDVATVTVTEQQERRLRRRPCPARRRARRRRPSASMPSASTS
jgi:two-component system chemotaxis sensor kinase CheA